MFSKPGVVDKIREAFVPIALKAQTVSEPQPGAEAALYREIARSRPAPQGIAIANGHGKVLAWAVGFDDDSQVGTFFDHGVARHAEYPDASQPVPTQRFRRFPSMAMPELDDPGVELDLPRMHPPGDRCAGDFRYPQGTFLGRVYGRALDEDGSFKPRARSQETYVEDRFEIPAAAQQALASAALKAGDEPFEIPSAFARALVANAHLGQLDVAPLAGAKLGAKVVYDDIVLLARRVGTSPLRLSVTGRSDVGGEDVRRGASQGHGPLWKNRIELEWQGTVDLDGGRVVRVALIADGRESLEWGTHIPFPEGDPEVAHLMSGRRLKIESRVRYGVTGRPISDDEIDPDPAPPMAGLGPRVHLLNLLGEEHRDLITGEIDLPEERRKEFAALIDAEARQLQSFLESIADIPDAERPKRLIPYRDLLKVRLDAAIGELPR